MRPAEHSIDALDELRESLREAARRDVAAHRVTRSRRRRRRTTVFALTAVLLVGVAVAGTSDRDSVGPPAARATDLISTGEPLPDIERPAGVLPATEPQLVISARNRGAPGRFGVATFQSADGEACVLAGELRGAQLGIVAGGRFRPYEPGHAGPCARSPYRVVDQLVTAGPPKRTLWFGRMGVSVHRVVAQLGGHRFTTRTGPGGAFMFVFDGDVPSNTIRIFPEPA